MVKYVTYEQLTPLGKNIPTVFKILHPDGLDMRELKEKTKERNFYLEIYKYLARGEEDELCV